MNQRNVYLQTPNTFGSRYTCVTTYDANGKAMPESYPYMTFITREMFNELTRLGHSVDELSDLSSYSRLKSMSQSTHIQLLVLNQRLSKFFCGFDVYSLDAALGVEYSVGRNHKDPMVSYAETAFNVTQRDAPTPGYVLPQDPGSEPGEETFYEIFPASGQRQLVVVEKHFLYHLTQCKDNTKAFVLAYLSHLDHFGLTSVSLNEFYLKLLFVDQFHQVLTLRA